jgi:uncharacterized membrane-anchored protein
MLFHIKITLLRGAALHAVDYWPGGEVRSNIQLNWRRSLALTVIALVCGLASAMAALEASGVWQIVLLAVGVVGMFLFFAGIYVTLVRRYYYRQP